MKIKTFCRLKYSYLKKRINKMSSNNNHDGGVSFLGLLTILFIGLKLGNVITWSWLEVLSPLWGPIVLLLGFVISATIVGLIVTLWDKIK